MDFVVKLPTSEQLTSGERFANLAVPTADPSRIDLPTSWPGELSSHPKLILLPREQLPASLTLDEESKEVLEHAHNHFERLGRRERIHQVAVERHLKLLTKSSFALAIETFDDFYRTSMQVPPPLLLSNIPFDVKAAVARGRALAFSDGSLEAERAWAYGHTIPAEDSDDDAPAPYIPQGGAHTDSEGCALADPARFGGREMGPGSRRDVLEQGPPPFSSAEAKAAIANIEALAQRLVSHQERRRQAELELDATLDDLE
ncbi:hypothetical protein C8F04DRAFT_1275911 [Mycena alexandri]|uniref:Uncharacterized protein n=1 Tax=Mycena alexandri TaxID=1745969 RepID=A0AAD6S2C2_9AGAR|nr:hypothetical protein C8F04DRAFT_1275911 [Mycena alexandri]